MIGRRVAAGLIATAAVAAVAAQTAGAAASTPECRAGDLAGAIIDVQGAAGSQFGRLILVNKSSRTCHTKGFIGGQFVGQDGHALPTHVIRDHSTPARTVVIRSGAAGALQLRWSDVPSGSAPCARARWLRVTPPDDTRTLRVYFGAAPCRGDLEVRAITSPARV
jgi:hypothetical protein